MSTNPFVRLRRLIPPSPVWIGKVVSHNDADDTSELELPTGQGAIPYAGAVVAGSRIRARGRTVPVGSNAFVRDGVIETVAPDGTPVEIVIGKVVTRPTTLEFNGPVPAQQGYVGVAFSLSLGAYWAGGTTPYTWSLTSGSLPMGLTLNTNTGVISGTPSVEGAATSVTVRCLDYLGVEASGTVSFLAITTQSAGGGPWATLWAPGAIQSALSDGSKLATFGPGNVGSGSSFGVFTDAGISGKVYCEFEVSSSTNSNCFKAFGIVRSADANPSFISSNNYAMFGRGPNSWDGCGLPYAGLGTNGSVETQSSYNFQVGDRIGVAVDADSGKIWYRKNGSWISGNPSAGTSPSQTFTPGSGWKFAFSAYSCIASGATIAARIYPTGALQTGSLPSGFLPYQ